LPQRTPLHPDGKPRPSPTSQTGSEDLLDRRRGSDLERLGETVSPSDGGVFGDRGHRPFGNQIGLEHGCTIATDQNVGNIRQIRVIGNALGSPGVEGVTMSDSVGQYLN